jgi:glycosyltransferase involved in cell wall biosynthesis
METDENGPLVSIVMPLYNHERFVAEALEAVFAQTYSPLDIVIVDDCSPDASAEIVSARLERVPDRSNIRFIRNPTNLGLLGACEVGFSAARGGFIVLANDDDIMTPEMVAEMVSVWRSEGVSLVTTNAEYIDADSNLIGRTHRDLQSPADDSFETLVRDGSNACCFGASFGFDRKVYSTFGLPPAHLNNLDIVLPFFAYLLKGGRFLNKPLLRYRVHGKNDSLSLMEERADPRGKLEVRDRIFYGHIAHAIVMLEELDQLSLKMPDRYRELAPHIGPLLTIQVVEMARKMVRNRIELAELKS